MSGFQSGNAILQLAAYVLSIATWHKTAIIIVWKIHKYWRFTYGRKFFYYDGFVFT
jgi:hypothetical protein